MQNVHGPGGIPGIYHAGNVDLAGAYYHRQYGHINNCNA